MISDPIYRAILDGLEQRDVFDGDRFEACVVGLLQDRFPGLVPIPGGNDGGMDGAIADLEGEAYPLVCTIAERGLANLTRSLKRYKKTGGKRRKVVFATCRRVTPQKRRNLRSRARKLGFTLVQVYEQRAIATLLYRQSDWRRDLLRLDGSPPALSVLPPRLRQHLIELEIRGRDRDLEWLRTTSGDRVLVGEPGSGKTYAFYRLARDGWGLFLTSESEAEIADALRDQKPGVVIVDDAHVDPSRLARLRALRAQGTHRFDIVASTWRGAENEVRDALGVWSSKVRRLELLTRREILDLYAEMGVTAEEFGLEKDRILGTLADQAANRPGLAVTLGTLWLEGDWQSVLEGISCSSPFPANGIVSRRARFGPSSLRSGERPCCDSAARNVPSRFRWTREPATGWPRSCARIRIWLSSGFVGTEPGPGVTSRRGCARRRKRPWPTSTGGTGRS